MKNLKPLPFVVTLSCSILLLILGFWQLNKYLTKRNFYSQTKDLIENSAILYNKETLAEFKTLNHRILKVKGHFINGKEIFLYKKFSSDQNNNQKSGQYIIMSPFKLEDGKIFMVARGALLDNSRTKKSISMLNFNDEVTLEVLVLPSEPQPFFINFADMKNNIWFFVLLKEIKKYVKENIDTEYYFLIQQDYSASSSMLLPIKYDFNQHQRYMHHLWYAINWFGMFISLITIYVFTIKNKHMSI